MVSVDVKQHWTMLTHWSQLVPNNYVKPTFEDIKQHRKEGKRRYRYHSLLGKQCLLGGKETRPYRHRMSAYIIQQFETATNRQCHTEADQWKKRRKWRRNYAKRCRFQTVKSDAHRHDLKEKAQTHIGTVCAVIALDIFQTGVTSAE